MNSVFAVALPGALKLSIPAGMYDLVVLSHSGVMFILQKISLDDMGTCECNNTFCMLTFLYVYAVYIGACCSCPCSIIVWAGEFSIETEGVIYRI